LNVDEEAIVDVATVLGTVSRADLLAAADVFLLLGDVVRTIAVLVLNDSKSVCATEVSAVGCAVAV
jgi:hypothetical protein